MCYAAARSRTIGAQSNGKAAHHSAKEGLKMLVTDSFVAQGLHTQIDLIISLSWASGSGSHSPASTT